MQRLYDTISAASSDNMSLKLHVLASLEPGDRFPTAERLYLDASSGRIALLKGTSREVVLPDRGIAENENPDVMAVLSPSEAIHFKAMVSFDHVPMTQFSDREARHWMGAVDDRVARRVGPILDLIVPDAKAIVVSVPARSEFEVSEDGVVRKLVINQGDVPYDYELLPRKYSRDAIFRSTVPVETVQIRFPIVLDSWHRD